MIFSGGTFEHEESLVSVLSSFKPGKIAQDLPSAKAWHCHLHHHHLTSPIMAIHLFSTTPNNAKSSS